MPNLVYDYADIASRMKGELKEEPAPKVELTPRLPAPNWWSQCYPCRGTGANLIHGGTCDHCNGSGAVP